jgi:uncharacterized protein (TIGR00369 family)
VSSTAAATLEAAPIAPAVLATTSGIDLLRMISNGEQPMPPMMKLLDFRPSEVEPGFVVFEGVPQRMHYNPIGSVHGGYHAALLDSCMGCAIYSLLDIGEAWTTLEIKINYVRALTDATGPVRAEGKVIHRSRQIGTAEGRIVDADGKLYAHGTTTCLIFPARAGA